jgi:Na+:H+ antiporter, NhaA family
MSDQRLFSRGSWPEASRVAELFRQETVGGILLLTAAGLALIAANLGDSYADIRDTVVGPSALHLDLSVGTWAADGLLAIFFFVAGLELKRELVAGDLRDLRHAAVPVVAAIGGVVLPALVYLGVNLAADDGEVAGWAIPTATDIAFALAVLAIISTHLPSALRTFLLTLAIVDDLLAITIIAFFLTDDLDLAWLVGALVPIAAFAVLVRKRVTSWWLLVPLALAAWTLVHGSGVHATVAGVLLAFTVPVLRQDGQDGHGLAEHLEHVMRPLSAAVAVPIFAFFSAGVTIDGWSELTDALRDPITVGIVLGLFVGKSFGVFGATWLMSTFTHARLDGELSWWDVLGLSMLSGVGFTVSLLIGELTFGLGSEADERAKIGVLVGSFVAATAAAVVLRARNRVYRRIEALETADPDHDGIPDVFLEGAADSDQP